jgi:hypothetical protein
MRQATTRLSPGVTMAQCFLMSSAQSATKVDPTEPACTVIGDNAMTLDAGVGGKPSFTSCDPSLQAVYELIEVSRLQDSI